MGAGHASTGPRSSGDVRSEPHPRAEKCELTPLFLFRVAGIERGGVTGVGADEQTPLRK
jgi:hypothetical protein